MEATFSNEFKKHFLLVFTKTLIAHSAKVDITKLQRIIELKEKTENLPSILNKEPIIEGIRELRRINLPTISRPVTRQFNNPTFNIPESKLPPHLEYLKPVATSTTEIDLFKLNPLIKDSAVKIITGSPDEAVSVTGTMGTKPTSIVLNKEDIDRIINVFSTMSKIPATEGIYKVAIGSLVLSAIISNVVGSRFVIKKLSYYIPPKPLQRKI
jgi:hypothetical protein